MAKKKVRRKKKSTRGSGSSSKAERIRQYDIDHPGQSVKEVVEALSSIGVTPPDVYNVRARSSGGKKKKRRKAKRGRPAGTASSSPTGADGRSIEAAANLIKSAGGVAKAKAALATAERVAKALQ
jgi:hypothetical protein